MQLTKPLHCNDEVDAVVDNGHTEKSTQDEFPAKTDTSCADVVNTGTATTVRATTDTQTATDVGNATLTPGETFLSRSVSSSQQKNERTSPSLSWALN